MPALSLNPPRLLWPVLVALLIFAASSRSHVPGPTWPGFDKVVHFSVYALLGTLVCRSGRGKWAAGLSLLIVSFFGFTDEWHQSFVPGRRAEFADWVADTLGALAGIALYAKWEGYRCWLERPVRGSGTLRPPDDATE